LPDRDTSGKGGKAPGINQDGAASSSRFLGGGGVHSKVMRKSHDIHDAISLTVEGQTGLKITQVIGMVVLLATRSAQKTPNPKSHPIQPALCAHA
jgi:hypothetical protein